MLTSSTYIIYGIPFCSSFLLRFISCSSALTCHFTLMHGTQRKKGLQELGSLSWARDAMRCDAATTLTFLNRETRHINQEKEIPLLYWCLHVCSSSCLLTTRSGISSFLRLSNIRNDLCHPMEPCFGFTTHLAAYFQRRGLYENENRSTF